LIALSACLHGEIPHAHQGRVNGSGRSSGPVVSAGFLAKTIFSLKSRTTVYRNPGDGQPRLAGDEPKLSIPLVASNDCHYLDKEDAVPMMCCCASRPAKTVNDTNRFRFSTDQLYLNRPKKKWRPI
jgi:DNA polymerase-3 subunit alpha